MTDTLAESVIEDEAWSAVEDMIDACERVLHHAATALDDVRQGVAAIMLTNDQMMQDLNARFRGKDKPTNVLSFPAPDREGYPGDVVMAYETCASEAEAAGKSVLHHAAHLALHGVLHLNGFDHQEEDEASEMEALETAVLAELGIKDPYLIQE